IFLLCCAVAVLTFFIAGLLYLLRFKRVDNLGAYTASRLETGLLIPSDLGNCPRIPTLSTACVADISPGHGSVFLDSS
ncbi:MAG TPA: hypothetical protein VFF64_02720, partial [Candidatus Eremiobacteraceae bacterium]|nr:hypothetical protein [Candidatus Eremiobacteraceae bacterium]